MPLPTGGAWPLPSEQPVLAKMREHAAWYAGDTTDLAKIYSSGRWQPRPSQYAGGIVGTLSRMFWGAPTSGQSRMQLHIPLAADIATASADLLYADPVRITFEDAKLQEAFDLLREQLDLDAILVEANELSAALGGSYVRVGFDTAAEDETRKPIISTVWGDQAIPEFHWGRLVAVTFWQELEQQGGKIIRHLERHEPGKVIHGLYAGSADSLGSRIPLSENPRTAGITADADGAVNSGIPNRLAVVYFPNMRPNRMFRTPHGRSDFDGIEGQMDALDRAWSSWMRDIDLGKSRVFIPQYMFKDLGPGKGATWDNEREIFEEVKFAPSKADSGTGLPITVAQFKIRVEEHSRTCRELIERAVTSAGYSLASFGLGDEGTQATATEVEARKDRSHMTRDKKARYQIAAIRDLAEILLTAVNQPPATPTVDFSETVQADPLKLAQTALALRQAEAASTETLVKMQHPDWTPDQVAEEVTRILRESGRSVTDPGSFTGGDPNQPPPTLE